VGATKARCVAIRRHLDNSNVHRRSMGIDQRAGRRDESQTWASPEQAHLEKSAHGRTCIEESLRC
jgi:hypothetical protein